MPFVSFNCFSVVRFAPHLSLLGNLHSSSLFDSASRAHFCTVVSSECFDRPPASLLAFDEVITPIMDQITYVADF